MDGRPDPLAALTLTLVFALVTGCLGIGSSSPEPPCPGEMVESADGLSCVEPEETCYAWLSGKADKTVTCNAQSKDGRGELRVNLQGGGKARVVVLDGDEENAFDRNFTFSHASLHDVRGKRGEWTLQVTFMDAGGSANVRLWG